MSDNDKRLVHIVHIQYTSHALVKAAAELNYTLIETLCKNEDVNNAILNLALREAGKHTNNETDIEAYKNTISILVGEGADINYRIYDSTLLHDAVKAKNKERVAFLLENEADIVGITDNITPLHVCAEMNWCDGMKLFDKYKNSDVLKDKVNESNIFGDTPLHFSAKNGCCKCVELLLKWGGNLSIINEEGYSPPYYIFLNMAQPVKFFRELMDKCVISNGKDQNSNNYEVSLDFNFLIPNAGTKQMPVIMAILEGTSTTQQQELLDHPLLETFLRLKWFKLRDYYYWMLGLYFFFVLTFSTFIMMFMNGITNSVLFPICRYTTMAASVLLLVQSLIQVYFLRKLFLRQLETYMHNAAAIMALIISICADVPPQKWILHVTSYAILLAWTQLMFYIGRLPTCGYYALLFISVAKNILKVLLTFCCLILGFTISFSVQYHASHHFLYPWRAFVKTITMMMGEFEYAELFSGLEHSEDGKGTGENVAGLEITSRLLFIIFLVVTSITLINLMVGLAVSDIQGLLKEGHVLRLVKQSYFLMHLEKLPDVLVKVSTINKNTQIRRNKHVGQSMYRPLPMKIYVPLVELAEANKVYQAEQSESETKIIEMLVKETNGIVHSVAKIQEKLHLMMTRQY